MLLEDLARELVPVTSELLGGRTLNVMNTSGIIIASTEKERIGTFHRGALEAVQTGKTVNITKEQLPLYPGAKEGCNMPLRLNGEIIGAVGIYGNPGEIAHLARLWEAYASKAYMLEMMTNPQLEEAKIRGRILRNLLYPREGSYEDALSWMAEQNIKLTPTLRVAVGSDANGLPLEKRRIDGIVSALSGVFQTSNMIWGIESDRIIFVLGNTDRSCGEKIAAATADIPINFSLSGGCREISGLPRAYRMAGVLRDLGVNAPTDADEPVAHTSCLLAEEAAQEEPVLFNMTEQAAKVLRPEEWIQLLGTAEQYYADQRSVGRAATRLFVHKNTLQYRMKRLYEVLQLDNVPDFEREYMIRMLIIREKRKQGLRALK